MTIYEKLKLISEDEKKEKLVKYYLLACTEKYVGYRSKGTVSKAIHTAKKCMKGFERWEKLHDLEWLIEAEAFEVDHYIVGVTSYWPRLSAQTKSDLLKIRLRYNLCHRESLLYLRDLAYFIDSVFVYVAFSKNGIPNKQYEQYMCPKLFKHYFKKNP
jgi:hypothetical protein